MSRSIDGAECSHGVNVFDPGGCGLCDVEGESFAVHQTELETKMPRVPNEWLFPMTTEQAREHNARLRERREATMRRATDSGGWLGMALILGSYALLAAGVIKGESPSYHLMLFVGCFLVAVSCHAAKAWPPFALNVAFTLLAAVTLLRMWLA